MFCLFCRWKVSNTFDNEGELSSGCRRHLMRCERCRSFFTASLALGERLSLEAALAQPAVPARLGSQVTAMIGHRAGTQADFWSGHWRSVAAACAAVILMPVIFWGFSYLPAGGADSVERAQTANLEYLLNANVGSMEQFAESVGGLLERPLTTEVETLQKQTKSAFEFLMACSGADMAIRRQAM